MTLMKSFLRSLNLFLEHEFLRYRDSHFHLTSNLCPRYD